MKTTDKKSARREFRVEEESIRSIMNEWDPIEESPPDEYDCIVHHILSGLHRGINDKGISQIIKDQFDHHFGLPMPQDEIETTSRKIWQWWVQRKNEIGASNQAL